MGDAVFTIGYERSTLPDLIAALRAAGVETVVDVRAVAASRRAGFSKTILRETLEAEGVAYEHLRSLGTPKPGREAARRGRIAEMEEIFGAYMETPDARAGLVRAVTIARERRTALLCFEACAAGCHRRIVADMICEETGMSATHL